MTNKFKSCTAYLISAICIGCSDARFEKYAGWENYGGTKEMIRYSSLKEIDTSNVNTLKPVWEYHTGDADTLNHSQIQCNPIIVNGTLFGISPQMKLFAVDASNGKELWVFDPLTKTEFDNHRTAFHNMINGRGVTYWSDGKEDRRIFYTAGSNTYAIDALTGRPVSSFGNNGSIDLHEGLGRDVANLFVVNTSPGIIYKDLIILGSRVNESPPAAPGHIRAFDVKTGKMRWIFHTIPQPGEYGFDTWEDSTAWKYMGGANVWSGFSLDEKKGLLFASTGSASYDFYGGNRKGTNLFANCVLALDALTGKRVWHQQLVHHDLWDKDLPTPPALVEITRNGKRVEAVAQPTKNGLLYVFERENGKPVFEIKEIPVDTMSDLTGEKVWPTQPVPVRPVAFSRQTLTEDEINPFVPDSSKRKIKAQMKGFRYGNMFIPPGKTPSLVFPGYDGGAEWGGPAFDPETGILYVNANEMAWIMQMEDNKDEKGKVENYLSAGQRLYRQNCESCHGADRKGTGNNPSLIGIQAKYKINEFTALIKNGRRMMPAFGQLGDDQIKAITAFVLDLKEEHEKKFIEIQSKNKPEQTMPYKIMGYTKFLTPEGFPAISPPWGTLNAIDLNKGELLWKQPLGEFEELRNKGVPATGTENYGGPVVTAGGIVFIAAARDGKIRAFHKRTGKLLWEYALPAPGFATPAIYTLNGKQFLVIACGGGKLNTKTSDVYIAFALPENK